MVACNPNRLTNSVTFIHWLGKSALSDPCLGGGRWSADNATARTLSAGIFGQRHTAKKVLRTALIRKQNRARKWERIAKINLAFKDIRSIAGIRNNSQKHSHVVIAIVMSTTTVCASMAECGNKARQ